MVGPVRTSTIDCHSLWIGYVTVTDEVPLLRPVSEVPKTPVESFFDAVSQRDRDCVLTGGPARFAHIGRLMGFGAVHIFPSAYEGYWNDCHFNRWITAPPATESDGSINSAQNGILLNLSLRVFFASYDVSINPDVRNSRSLNIRS